MKITSVVSIIALGAAVVVLAGCKRDDPPPPPPPPTNALSAAGADFKTAANQIANGAQQFGTAVKDEAVKVGDDIKAGAIQAGTEIQNTATNVAAQVKEKVEDITSNAQGTAQNLIDKARGEVDDTKYQDALKTLQGLASFKLSDDQQKQVDELRAKIRKALNSDSLPL